VSTGAISATRLERRARLLAWATVAWNVVETVVAIAAGAVASSIALVGFGLDSTVEVFSAVVILWQFRGIAHEREAHARKLIAVSFFVLAAYVAVQAVVDLVARDEPAASPVGIALAVASLLIMPALAMAKRDTGRRLHSHAVLADGNQTKLCAYLSAILLGGLVLNATLGWWWADPIAALSIAALAVNEGHGAWRGDACCD
jgi:divalent metal cation (Fe/Co/Zn/Cd) transporter